jgi:uncharacterized protein (TIGR03435 family)
MLSKIVSVALVCAAAQGQSSGPTFEVASVKPATPLGPMGMRSDRKGGPGTSDPGMYVCRNCPISWVLSEAYDLMPFEFTGPERLETARFDFEAKIAASTTKAAFRMMLQNLLVERFKMTVHREKREMPVFELAVAKNGPKIREAVPANGAKDDRPAGEVQRDKDGFPILTGGMTMAVVPGHARIRSDNQPISWFVRMLAGQFHGPVVDATGLKGNYDFLLSWAFGEADAPGGSADAYRPALVSAIQSQLGLKLEQKKGSAELLVVDSIEKAPTAN